MIAVICHDAGGAEIVSSWLKRQDEPYVAIVEGPAREIFMRKLGATSSVSMSQAIASADWVLCGTSWASDLEWRAIGDAAERGKPSVAYLDHWSNYRSRFDKHGQVLLPDEVWVGDVDAEQRARACFSAVPVRLVANAYFTDFAEDVRRIESSMGAPRRGLNVLFLGENQSTHGEVEHGNSHHFGYVETDLLVHLLGNLDRFPASATRLRIRPHPSETPQKYLKVISTVPDWVPPVEISEGPLAADVAWSHIVAGGTSMALVLAARANRLAVSCIPDVAIPIDLPGQFVHRLASLRKSDDVRQTLMGRLAHPSTSDP